MTEKAHVEIVILAPFFILALGALIRQTTKALPIPYTLTLLLIGTLFGFLLRIETWNDALRESINMLGNFDPHLLLHVFLPPLVFESAASIEWHLFSQAKVYICCLAGPGLLLSSSLTGLVLYRLLNETSRFQDELVASDCSQNSWSFGAALLLGCIMSATDPVAVVSLLKELGCKASLAVNIEGESLLNDGTALVMYTILVKIVEGDDSQNIGDYLVTFLKMSLGGAIFGVSFGFIIVQWLRLVFNDSLTEITITLSGAYLCFFIAEYFLHISGVLAVVCLGLYFGQVGSTSISPEVFHFLEEFWQCLGYIGNTLIFVVAGIVIGYKLPMFPLAEFGNMIMIYLVSLVIRALVIFSVYLVLKWLGYKLEFKDQIVAVWAGLRGAVGLSLAMLVFNNDFICEPVREVVMFYTSGMVVMTIFLNAVTMPQLISFLGLDTISPSKQLVFDQAMTTLVKCSQKQEALLKADHLFDSTIWDEARKYYFGVDHEKVKANGTLPGIDNYRKLGREEICRRVLMITKRSYWKQFQNGLLSHESVRYLIHHTDSAMDNNYSLDEWKTYEKLIRLGSTLDKGTDRLVASASSSETDKQKVRILNLLDSIPVLIIVLLLVSASCILPFTLDPKSVAFYVIENTTTIIFAIELTLRFYCLIGMDWNPFAVDPYIAIDVITVTLDLLLLSATDLLGDFSDFSKSLRTLRFLRLFRLLRLARVAQKITKAKVAALNEPNTLLGTEGWKQWYQRRVLFSQMKNGYEIASGFKVAREEALSAIQNIEHQDEDEDVALTILSLQRDLKDVHASLLDVQRLYHEIAASITTTLASRIVLNTQRNTISDLQMEGLLDSQESSQLKGYVEYQMKRLTYHPPIISMPNKIDILKSIPWMDMIPNSELLAIASSFEDAVFNRGDVLVRQNERSDNVFVLARGTVTVNYINEYEDEVQIDELGMGSVFGEISWALDVKRGATIKATSPGLLFTIEGSKLREIARSNRKLESNLWEVCGRRLSENILATNGYKSRDQLRNMVNDMTLYSVDPLNKKMQFYDCGKIILLRGTAIIDVGENAILIEAPNLLSASSGGGDLTFDVTFSTDAKFMCNKYVFEGFKGNNERKLSALAELEIKTLSGLPRVDSFTKITPPIPTTPEIIKASGESESTTVKQGNESDDTMKSQGYILRRSTITNCAK